MCQTGIHSPEKRYSFPRNVKLGNKPAMTMGFTVALVLFAETAAAGASQTPAPASGPAATSASKAAEAAKPDGADCAPQSAAPKSSDIVICAVKPNGYRLDPDVMEAKRAKKQGAAGRPHSPHETFADHSCATVGPMGCRGAPAINLLAAAAVAAEIADRLSKGQEVGSLFETTPDPSEYQLYQEAKKLREEKEADAKAKAAQAQAQANAANPTTPAK